MDKAQVILIPWFFFTGLYLLSPGLAKPKYQTLLINETSKIFVEIVTSREEQRKGLGYRNQLEDGKRMLFVYSNSSERIFWMKGMRFPIDIIWIVSGKIIQIKENIPPPSLLISDKNLETFGHGIYADMVLEVPSGYSKKNRFKKGDKIRILTQK